MEDNMQKSLKMALYGVLCGAVFATTLPAEVLAGPMSAPDPSAVALSSSVEKIHYRGYGRGYGRGYYRRGYYGGGYGRGYYRRGYYGGGYGRGYYRRGYYSGYGYNPAATLFGGVASGLLGAGLAASRGGYYGGGYSPYYGGGWGGGYYPYYGGGWGW
jgi:hypothetical protein